MSPTDRRARFRDLALFHVAQLGPMAACAIAITALVEEGEAQLVLLGVALLVSTRAGGWLAGRVAADRGLEAPEPRGPYALLALVAFVAVFAVAVLVLDDPFGPAQAAVVIAIGLLLYAGAATLSARAAT